MVTTVLNFALQEIFIIIMMCMTFNIILHIPKEKRKIFYIIFTLSMYIFNVQVVYLQYFGTWIPYVTTNSKILMSVNTLLYIITLKVITGLDYLKILLADAFAQMMCGIVVFIPFTVLAKVTKEGAYSIVHLHSGVENILGLIATMIIISLLIVLYRKIIKHYLAKFYRWKLKARGALWGFIVVFTAGGLFTTSGDAYKGDDVMIATSGGLVVFWVAVLYVASLVIRSYKEKQLQEESTILTIENTVMKEYYNTLEYQLEHTRKFRHDIEKHMNVIKEMLEKRESNNMNIFDDEEKQVGTSSLKQLKEMISEEYLQMNEESYCNSPIINAMLANKKRLCDNENIGLKIQVSEIELGNIKEMDFIAVVANLLDNAIEECRKVKNCMTEIEFSCGSAGEDISIIVCNTTQKEKVSDGGTTKKDTYAHGVGLLIVNDVVNKYKGAVKVSINHGNYETKIVLKK